MSSLHAKHILRHLASANLDIYPLMYELYSDNVKHIVLPGAEYVCSHQVDECLIIFSVSIVLLGSNVEYFCPKFQTSDYI